MENGVLRGNRAAASNLWVLLGLHRFAGGQFRTHDPRAAKVGNARSASASASSNLQHPML